jgi:oligopeptide transport system ATP-binding protein
MMPDSQPGSASNEPVLRVENLVKHFRTSSGGSLRGTSRPLKAVDGVTFELHPGETLGVVGESGCGKSTLAQTLLRLEEPTSGHAYYKGEDIYAMSARRLRAFRREAQIIFQDPYEALNPRMTVGQIVAEPWSIHSGVVPRGERRSRASALLEKVGLRPDYIDRYPGQFSGGQRQRISVARALALNPGILVCDEPVSALDMPVQAQVLNLLRELQADLGLSYIFISHDLSVVRYIADRIAVMYLGRIVEVGTEEQIFTRPMHPYTQALLSAIPSTEPGGRARRILLEGDVASPIDIPTGCRFRTRCWKAEDVCAEQDPGLLDRLGDGQLSACHLVDAGMAVSPAAPDEQVTAGVPKTVTHDAWQAG